MNDVRSLAAWLPRTPFWTLVAHFVKRALASEDEEGSEGMSLGLGMALAMLAAPGAFASIFLLDKYSTLLQWFRGQKAFDPYRASVADEYFFVVLSMTITGLVMVLRWNKLFPDRRDFWNLAVLPIPIRHVFLACFTAIFGLALLFAIDVNLVSALLFPIFVTIGDGSIGAFWRVACGHLSAVFSASLFSFFAVFGLVGLLMLVVPARLLRPVSVAVRILLVVGLLTEFLANLFLQLLSGRLPSHTGSFVRFLPSFWFLGIYQSAAHIGKPVFARFAITALLATIIAAIAAYALCYRRHFLRLAESFESLGARKHGWRLRFPAWLFRSPFEQACNGLAVKVLMRSERHVMVFGGYMGVGLVIVTQTLFDHGATSVLEVPLLIAFCLISGLRVVFDVPAALNANWIFRLTAADPHPTPNSIARRFMLLIVLPCITLPCIIASGWTVGLKATVLNITFAALAIELTLWRFHQIPFTYSVERDSRQIVIRILGGILTVLLLVPLLALTERWASADWRRLALVAALLGIAFFDLRRRRRERLAEEDALTFEERPASAYELLKLV